MFQFSWGKPYGRLAHSSMEQLEEELVISKASEKNTFLFTLNPQLF
tara:strand:- start:85 stop:222 length:138 start_codon:yes stop_codon:yes gene_type:complete